MTADPHGSTIAREPLVATGFGVFFAWSTGGLPGGSGRPRGRNRSVGHVSSRVRRSSRPSALRTV